MTRSLEGAAAPLRYGLLTYPHSPNLGDEIQSLAARQFLPRVDRLISRDALDRYRDDSPIRLILNGWFLDRPRRWPPHPAIAPLLTSFHIADDTFSHIRPWFAARVRNRLLSRESVAYFNRHGPVGARDRRTEALLRSRGVDAYYSGCLTLTLTLPRRSARAGDGPVIACDLPPAARSALAARLGCDPLAITHLTEERDPHARLALAEGVLDLYAGASAVITTRLHAALPCLAIGTPVLFLSLDEDNGRLQPALELCHSTDLAGFLSGQDGFDPRDPPPNPQRHLAMAAALRERCEAFVAAPAG